jgi:hypothetical protein
MQTCKLPKAGETASDSPGHPTGRTGGGEMMGADTIYMRQYLDLMQAGLRELIGVNLTDVYQLQDELMEKAEKFTDGTIQKIRRLTLYGKQASKPWNMRSKPTMN